MGKPSTHQKKVRDCYMVLYRKKGWGKLSELMNKKQIVNKINNDSWNDLTVDYKRQFLNNILAEYCGNLKSIGMQKSQIVRTKSYILLKGLCKSKSKTLASPNFRLNWNSIRFCALKHA